MARHPDDGPPMIRPEQFDVTTGEFHGHGEGAIPARVGRYRIDRLLGQGGFGVVYQAWDEQLERTVAVKVPHRHLVDRVEHVRMYLAEAQAVAKLDHPHIVPVFDVGSSEAHPVYIVYKYQEGETLAQRQLHNPLADVEIASLLVTLSESLHYAHKQRLVHRDIKPGNVLIDPQGQPYLVDFGVALRETTAKSGPHYAGTPRYMSPEQARGEGHRVDGRSDIFSLGVMLYELLVGQPPFTGESRAELLGAIIDHDPRPPRQFDDRIPKELERICLKAMSKRTSERYTTALDLADELRRFLAEYCPPADASPRRAPKSTQVTALPADPGTAGSASSQEQVRVVPKGLRSFDAHDTDFFLELLPGPRDRHGLPESIRFWKHRIEDTDVEETFTVGLICGPSGCGKSSLVKAGLLPRLPSDRVATVYVEATGEDTEKRILSNLRKRFPQLPHDADVKEALAWLRRGEDSTLQQRVLLVLDQFEQWLHAHREEYDTDLSRALRHCDGDRLQCLLLVREDFWMAVTRLLYELEIDLVQGHNWVTVDLFDVRHARKVLHAFGVAYGALPPGTLSETQTQFLTEAVQGLARDGRVISVRLALFAEMIKSKPWAPSTLHDVGGTDGIGAAFLEETFHRAATPQLRLHQRAAREVLAALLPESGTEIKGHLRSYDELVEAAGYTGRPRAFAELMRVLDGELRLITPTDPEGVAGEDESLGPADLTQRYYQLTHDYLVPALRRWLTRKKMETPEGRAELLLAERSSLWAAKSDDRYLPSWTEYATIQQLTSSDKWKTAQQQMMQRAGAYHARKWVERLLESELPQVGKIVEQLTPVRTLVDPLLAEKHASAPEGSKAKLHLAMALLPVDERQLEYLYEQLLKAAPEKFVVLRDTLAGFTDRLLDRLWADSAGVPDEQLLRVAGMLAWFDAQHPGWATIGASVARALTETRPDHVGIWREALRPAKQSLLEPLSRIFQDPTTSPLKLSLTTALLADYAASDVALLTRLVADAKPAQFDMLLSVLSEHGSEAVGCLQAELAKQVPFPWADQPLDGEPHTVPDHVLKSISDADGIISERWLLLPRVPYERLDELLESLRELAFRPLRLRPYRCRGQVFVAAVCTRDGMPWVVASEAEAPRIVMRDEVLHAEGFLPDDVTVFEDPEGRVRFLALWSKATPEIPRRLLCDGRPEEAERRAQSLQGAGFNLDSMSCLSAAGQPTHVCGVWSRPREEQVTSTRCYSGSMEDFRDDACPGYLLTDVTLGSTTAAEVPAVTALWSVSLNWESRALLCRSTSEHREAAQRLATEHYRPAAVSVVAAVDERAIQIASVWHRPRRAEADKDRSASRQANAAVALLRMGREQPVWPLFKHQPDPRLRSYLVHAVAHKGVLPAQIISRLAVEPEVSSRRALLLSLGEFDERQLSPAERKALLPQLAALYRNDPDAGVHAAVAWTLRRWGEKPQLEKLDRKLALKGRDERHWFVNGQLQTFSVIPAPGEVLIGSPPYEWGREGGPEGNAEMQHFDFLGHGFAIMSYQVTIDQFLRFRPDFTYRQTVSPRGDCPVNTVSWYDAAAYCNWLNEQEHIPADQWCYAPNGDGQYAAGMTIAADWHVRTGYRMPTEVEWEYACRAGARTANFFGETTELSSYYAWTSLNSGGEALASVGSFKPNDFGIFDPVGNNMEWCQNEYYDCEQVEHADVARKSDADKAIADSRQTGMRCSSIISPVSSIRTASRYRLPTLVGNWSFGLRMAKTVGQSTHMQGASSGRAIRGQLLTSPVRNQRSAYRAQFPAGTVVWTFGLRPARTV